MSILDREYLEDYEQRERSRFEKFSNDIHEGKFSLRKDRYPPDEYFVNLNRPVATTTSGTTRRSDIWAQIPFSGSLILLLEPLSEPYFEKIYFPISDIPEIIDFIRETGRLQVALSAYPLLYQGFDHLAPFFTELRPPCLFGVPPSIYGNKKEIRQAQTAFYTLAKVKYFDFLDKIGRLSHPRHSSVIYKGGAIIYTYLRLCHYSIAEDIENLLIDDPPKAFLLLKICQHFITGPLGDLRSDLINYSCETTKEALNLPLVYQPQEISFPCEIGKFLLKKLTYAAQDMRACYDLIDHYDAYDLMKVQESLNDAIVTKHPDIVNKSIEEFSEILDNVWNDSTIPRQIKNLKRGLPVSIAAIGTAVSAFTGGIEGFLAGLGFSVGAKFLDAEIEGLSERLVKFLARSYQANVYDFKKKYKNRIAK